MLKTVKTALGTILVFLLLVFIWQIGIVLNAKPEQIIPDTKNLALAQNPLFIYKFVKPNSILAECEGDPYLEDGEGNWVERTVASGGDYYLMYPSEKFGEEERLISGFLVTCYLKPFFTDIKKTRIIVHNKYLDKRYDVGGWDYSQSEFNQLISSYSDLSVAVKEIVPKSLSPFKKKQI